MMNKMMLDACLLSLASNINAAANLKGCRDQLAILGDIRVTPILVNHCQQAVDKQTIPNYHNQLVVVALKQPTSYTKLLAYSKQLEQAQGRATYRKPLVTLDVDILAVHQARLAAEAGILDATDNLVTVPLADGWLALAKRLPLAAYEQQNLIHLPPPFASLFAEQDPSKTHEG